MEKRESGKAAAPPRPVNQEILAGKNDLERRTLAFAISVVRFAGKIPWDTTAAVVTRQLVRAATSIGANYREANRAESRDDFVHKTALAQKEASETQYWIEICVHAEIGDSDAIRILAQESRELLAILTTINRKAKGR